MREGFELSWWREDLFQKYPNLKADIEKQCTLSHPEKSSIFVKTDDLCPRCNQRTDLLGNHVNILNHSCIKDS